jgi:aspartyl-tRNA(Asn)/glutamyl-tRNA(Gln) amidotransferase subunit A
MVEACVLNAERLDRQLAEIDPVVSQRMLRGREASAVDYARTLADIQRLRAACADTWRDSGVDALLVPTTMQPALPLAAVDADFDTYMTHANRYMRNCYVGNLLDLTAVSLPCGFTAKGLPIGLMVYAPSGREDLALRVAHAYEQHSDWHRQRPPLAA